MIDAESLVNALLGGQQGGGADGRGPHRYNPNFQAELQSGPRTHRTQHQPSHRGDGVVGSGELECDPDTGLPTGW
jgi:hypothetical protein